MSHRGCHTSPRAAQEHLHGWHGGLLLPGQPRWTGSGPCVIDPIQAMGKLRHKEEQQLAHKQHRSPASQPKHITRREQMSCYEL